MDSLTSARCQGVTSCVSHRIMRLSCDRFLHYNLCHVVETWDLARCQSECLLTCGSGSDWCCWLIYMCVSVCRNTRWVYHLWSTLNSSAAHRPVSNSLELIPATVPSCPSGACRSTFRYGKQTLALSIWCHHFICSWCDMHDWVIITLASDLQQCDASCGSCQLDSVKGPETRL